MPLSFARIQRIPDRIIRAAEWIIAANEFYFESDQPSIAAEDLFFEADGPSITTNDPFFGADGPIIAADGSLTGGRSFRPHTLYVRYRSHLHQPEADRHDEHAQAGARTGLRRNVLPQRLGRARFHVHRPRNAFSTGAHLLDVLVQVDQFART